MNRVSNPAKVRKLSTMVGKPVVRAYARFFQDQQQILAFTSETEAYVVDLRTGDSSRYVDEPLRLTEHGVQVGGGQ